MRWFKRHFTHNLWLNIDRAMAGSLGRQVWLMTKIVLVLFGLFWLCITYHKFTYSEEPISDPILMLLYLFIDGNAFGSLIAYKENTHIDDTSLVITTVVYLLGILIFSGFLISILTNWYFKRVENYKQGKTSYLWSRHIVILGYDETVPSIIKRIFKECPPIESKFKRIFRNSTMPYILIQSSLPCDEVWEKLQRSAAYHDKNEKDHIILNHGHRISEIDLNKLNLQFAKHIYIIGDRSKSTHDSMNIESLHTVYRVLKKESPVDVKEITCLVENDDTFHSLQYLNVFEVFKNILVKLLFYNFYTEWVKTIFFNNTYGDSIKLGSDEFRRNYPVINQSSITYSDNKIVHIVVIGINNFGVSIGIEAAKTIHLPNFVRDSNLKTRITFIDIKADEEMQFFRTRYKDFFSIQSCKYIDVLNSKETTIEPLNLSKSLNDFLDISFEFVKGDVFSPAVQEMISDWGKEGNPMSVFITFKNQQKGLSLALHLPNNVYNTNDINIFIRQTRSDAFITLLRDSSKPIKNLYPFGMTDVYCNMSNNEEISRITNLLKYFEFDPDAMDSYISEDFDKSSWENILKESESLSNQLFFMDDAWENRHLYKAYSIRWWAYSLMKKDGVDSPAMINDLVDSEIDYYLQTEHNRKNVLVLLLGERIAPKYQDEDYYRSLGKSDIKTLRHKVGLFNRDNITEDDRKSIKITPQMIRSSYIQKKSKTQTLRPNTQVIINGELKGEWDLENEVGMSELVFDSRTGEFEQTRKKHYSTYLTPKYDYLYDSEDGTLKKTPVNLSAKIIEHLNPKMTLVFDDNSGDFVEVPSNIVYRYVYKLYRKMINN